MDIMTYLSNKYHNELVLEIIYTLAWPTSACEWKLFFDERCQNARKMDDMHETYVNIKHSYAGMQEHCNKIRITYV